MGGGGGGGVGVLSRASGKRRRIIYGQLKWRYRPGCGGRPVVTSAVYLL